MTMREQAKRYLTQAANRKRGPIGTASAAGYGSYVKAWIIPALGDLDLADVKPSTVKKLVARMVSDGHAPSTINLVVGTIKRIIKSAVDEEGEPLYPRTWSNSFMDVPAVVKSEQTAPIMSAEEVYKAISGAKGQDKALYTILAASGARIGEIQALKAVPERVADSYWSPETSTIYIRSTFTREVYQSWTKTDAGYREIDLHPVVNSYLMQAGLPKAGWLFRGKRDRNEHYRQSTAGQRLKKIGIDKGFHSFRRFRLTHLATMNVPSQLIKFWAGHASSDITDRYIKIGENIEIRKSWAEKAGTGFQI